MSGYAIRRSAVLGGALAIVFGPTMPMDFSTTLLAMGVLALVIIGVHFLRKRLEAPTAVLAFSIALLTYCWVFVPTNLLL